MKHTKPINEEINLEYKETGICCILKVVDKFDMIHTKTFYFENNVKKEGFDIIIELKHFIADNYIEK